MINSRRKTLVPFRIAGEPLWSLLGRLHRGRWLVVTREEDAEYIEKGRETV